MFPTVESQFKIYFRVVVAEIVRLPIFLNLYGGVIGGESQP